MVSATDKASGKEIKSAPSACVGNNNRTKNPRLLIKTRKTESKRMCKAAALLGWGESAHPPRISHVDIRGFNSSINGKELQVGSQTKTQLYAAKAEEG